MTQVRKMCFDKILPRDLYRPNRTTMSAGGRIRAIAIADKRWINGTTIRIRFLEGTQEQIDMVKEFAPQWTQHANLKFEFTDDIDAQIRVAFDSSDGAWSYVGTDNILLTHRVLTKFWHLGSGSIGNSQLLSTTNQDRGLMRQAS